MSPNPSKADIIQAILTNQSLTDDEKTLLVDEFIDEIRREYPELKYHATKSDVTELELSLTKEIELTRKEIKELDVQLTKEMAANKADTIKWVAGMLFVQVLALTGVFFGAFKLFLHH